MQSKVDLDQTKYNPDTLSSLRGCEEDPWKARNLPAGNQSSFLQGRVPLALPACCTVLELVLSSVLLKYETNINRAKVKTLNIMYGPLNNWAEKSVSGILSKLTQSSFKSMLSIFRRFLKMMAKPPRPTKPAGSRRSRGIRWILMLDKLRMCFSDIFNFQYITLLSHLAEYCEN